MDTGQDEQEITKLKQLEERVEREEETLEETLHEIRHDIEEITKHEHEPFKITVNNKPVVIIGHEHTGLEIKQAAIAAGVRIQLDFVLSEELSHSRSRIIGDQQRIRVESDVCFEAIPNDDHS